MMNAEGLPPGLGRGVYANRTLNLRAVKAIGYDMDYTLIHYHIEEWERCAYRYLQQKLVERGWPVAHYSFVPDFAIRGLVIDLELGNLVKANRFGYVTRAMHGRRQLSYEEQRAEYSRTFVELGEERWLFLNTFFSLSEACMYAQAVEDLDAGRMPPGLTYATLFRGIHSSLDEAHMDGVLKAEIARRPEDFVDLDPDCVRTLMEQAEAGKRVVLITNSEWPFTRDIMHYAFSRHLPAGVAWQDLFDLVVVAAGKPGFFTGQHPIFAVVDAVGHLLPVSSITSEYKVYYGGNAGLVEEYLGLSGSDILYVGDHVYADARLSKAIRRWRTAVIVRELEAEIAALAGFSAQQAQLDTLMQQKAEREQRMSELRLAMQGVRNGRPSALGSLGALQNELNRLREEIVAIDSQSAPLAIASGALVNPFWGPLMRAGNDKSHMARQIERHADVYTSRVSNFAYATPYAYLRAYRGALPHDLCLTQWGALDPTE